MVSSLSSFALRNFRTHLAYRTNEDMQVTLKSSLIANPSFTQRFLSTLSRYKQTKWCVKFISWKFIFFSDFEFKYETTFYFYFLFFSSTTKMHSDLWNLFSEIHGQNALVPDYRNATTKGENITFFPRDRGGKRFSPKKAPYQQQLFRKKCHIVYKNRLLTDES